MFRYGCGEGVGIAQGENSIKDGELWLKGDGELVEKN